MCYHPAASLALSMARHALFAQLLVPAMQCCHFQCRETPDAASQGNTVPSTGFRLLTAPPNNGWFLLPTAAPEACQTRTR